MAVCFILDAAHKPIVMAKYLLPGALALCLALSCAQIKQVHQPRQLPSIIPALHITDTTASALKMASLSVDVVVAANIATTTFDISYYNPNDRILEGEFDFPLLDGQQVTRYALDMNGALREGVVVEKAKARVAFENTVRRGIDPGLVEKTKGNNFRTRIYPIPAKGHKRVVIAIEQTLEQQDKDLLYQLPLYTDGLIDTFSLKTTVIKSKVKPQLDQSSLANFEFKTWKDAYVAEYHQQNFKADQTIAFSIPGTYGNDPTILTENYDGQTYFYVNRCISPQHRDKKKPATLGLFWDISASGDKRDLEKEMQLLQQYLAYAGDVSVSLVPFHIYALPKEDFIIHNGDAGQLIKRLKTFDYDGGTQFGALDLTKYNFDEALLFSDGLSTFGKEDISFANLPVTAITSSPSANYSYLKYIAQQSHGGFIDLGRQETTTALEALIGQPLQVIRTDYNPAEISELVLQTTPVLNTGLSFAGKLNAASATIKVALGFGNEVITTETFTITKDNTDYDQVKRIWATMQVNQLDLEYEKNKEAITRLGKTFSIITQNTSLLVLDRVEDYVQYEITPPAELQKEYFALLQEKKKKETDEKQTALTEALDAMARLKEWWNKDYSNRKIRKPDTERNMATDTLATVFERVEIEPQFPDSFVVGNTDTSRFNYRANSFSATISGSASSFSANEVTMEQHTPPQVLADGVEERLDEEEKEPPTSAAIELNDWKPDASYLNVLEKTAAGERKRKYFTLKKDYATQPSFFVDVARFFIENKEKEFGLQVLSNICELKLENAELLRIVANQLLDAGEKELAIETFLEILKIREEEPQSYRDLALACNETGGYNKAIDYLYKLVTGTWDSRFGDIKAIALNEMNALISAHPGMVNTSAIDPRFIYAMPVDVRIVVGWNTDNSDIDLWVTDPGKEKCFYQNQETGIGGKISADVTQGYGPEEFCLRKARNGSYVIDVNLYGDHRQNLGGPIAIKADLYTDFGRPGQQKKTINLRVTSNKEVINLGSLKFGS